MCEKGAYSELVFHYVTHQRPIDLEFSNRIMLPGDTRTIFTRLQAIMSRYETYFPLVQWLFRWAPAHLFPGATQNFICNSWISKDKECLGTPESILIKFIKTDTIHWNFQNFVNANSNQLWRSFRYKHREFVDRFKPGLQYCFKTA